VGVAAVDVSERLARGGFEMLRTSTVLTAVNIWGVGVTTGPRRASCEDGTPPAAFTTGLTVRARPVNGTSRVPGAPESFGAIWVESGVGATITRPTVGCDVAGLVIGGVGEAVVASTVGGVAVLVVTVWTLRVTAGPPSMPIEVPEPVPLLVPAPLAAPVPVP
jgi:hypothetical protein